MGPLHTASKGRVKTTRATLEKTLKPRYLGIGFVWAWIYCSFETSALYPDRHGISINADPSWLASAATVVIVLVATGIAWRNLDLKRMRWAHFAAPALVAGGTVLSAAASLSSPPIVALQYASGALSGIGSGWLCILWADALSRLDVEHIEIVVPAASVVTLLCTIVFPSIQGIPGVLAVASLPLASGALLLLAYQEHAPKRPLPRNAARTDAAVLGTVLRASLVLSVAYFAIGCVGAMSESEGLLQALGGFDVPTFIGSAFGIVMALCFVLYTVRIDFASLFRWLTPLLVLALALFPWQEVAPSFISNTITSVADTSMQVITYIYIISLAKKQLAPAALGIGITQGAVQLGVLVGNITGAHAAALVASGALNVFVFVLGLICAISFATLLVPQRTAKPVDRVSGSSEASEASRTELLCAALSSECGLSGRETEILGYLAKGRSQPYIREELFLSKNTVATHVKHIYQKLNVHSRQELLDLFEDA